MARRVRTRRVSRQQDELDQDVDGTRAARLRRRRLAVPEDHYGISMIGLVTTFVLIAFTGNLRWMRVVIGAILALTLYFTIKTSGASKRLLRISQFALVITFVITIVDTIISETEPVASYIVLGALSISAPVIVVKRLLQHPIVTLQTLVGAVVVYVLLGLSFTFLLISGELAEGPDFIKGATSDSIDYLYLSFITLTTVGYGDLTPTTNYGKMLVITEAVLAQIFLATVIARFASLFTGRERTLRHEESAASDEQ
jgi:Ion channel